MNNRDPFSLRRQSAVSILQSKAAGYTRRALESGKEAIESGRQVLEGNRSFSDAGMSFSTPKSTSNIDGIQRRREDDHWESSGSGRGNILSQSANGLGKRLGGIFEKPGLPMYKDKPYNYASSRRSLSAVARRRIITAAALFFLGLIYWFKSGSPSTENSGGVIDNKSKSWWGSSDSKAVDWNSRRESVKDAFKLSWDAYERYAWGYDEYHPLSRKGRQMVPNGMGWIIVDALDTLMLMNLTSRLSHAREWVATTLDYDQDHDVNTFETTIRMLGGLLSAHYLSTTFPDMAPLPTLGEGGEDLYLEKASDLANRLLGAFDSNTGIPYASVNLKTMTGLPSHDDGGASSTAEAASVQLEMKYLAKLTGEKDYWDKAERVIKVIDDNQKEDGLLPIFIYADQGTFRGNNIRLGSRGDSYYEYLIKQYLQTSKQEPIYQELWNQSLAGVRKHLITYSKPSDFMVLAERPNGLGGDISPKMDHLVCFMPGTIALGATGGLTEAAAKVSGNWGPQQEEEMRMARELMKTCWGMYKVTKTGLAPEIAHFHIHDPPKSADALVTPPESFDPSEDAEWRQDYEIKPLDQHNLQRPETVESLFYMWRITGDVTYRNWGWEMFRSFVEYTTVEDGAGFTSLDNANKIPPPKRDNMESFWLAETLKYLYLLFSPDDLIPLDQVVINTEAHIFPRFELGKLFSTGWQRKSSLIGHEQTEERSNQDGLPPRTTQIELAPASHSEA